MQTWLAQLGRKSGPRAPFFAPGNISAGFILKPHKRRLKCTAVFDGKGKSNERQQPLMRAAWQWCLPWVLLLAFGHAALALDPQRSLDHYGHQAWRTDSGLPQNTVHSILQTRDGYLWLGTDGGLVRFDGMDFVTFDAENTPQFKSDTRLRFASGRIRHSVDLDRRRPAELSRRRFCRLYQRSGLARGYGLVQL